MPAQNIPITAQLLFTNRKWQLSNILKREPPCQPFDVKVAKLLGKNFDSAQELLSGATVTLDLLPPRSGDLYFAKEDFMHLVPPFPKLLEHYDGENKELTIRGAIAWYTGERQKLLQRIETELSDLARELGCGSATPPSGKTDVFALLQRIADLRGEVRALLNRQAQLSQEVSDFDVRKREHDRLGLALDRLRQKVNGLITRWKAYDGFTPSDEELLTGGFSQENLPARPDEPDWKQVATDVHRDIHRKHSLLYPKHLIENVLSLVCTHDTLIFAGRPGCGKTALVRALAAAVGAPEPTIIPVKPNWNSSDDLFGYWNAAESHFVSTAFTDAILSATADQEHLYFICLDEMNLARVEYYFADLLSALELRTNQPQVHLISQSVVRWLNGRNQALAAPYQILEIPNNVRIIGCLNMDETTTALSPKVLDRVHVLSFPEPFDTDPDKYELEISDAPRRQLKLHGGLFARNDYPPLGSRSEHDPIVKALKAWREPLADMAMHLSPRFVRQAMNYRNCLTRFVGNEKADWLALNNTLLQKLLPRLEHDAVEQEDADRRHKGVGHLLEVLESSMNRPKFNDNDIPPVTARSILQKMYNEAARSPDKRYRFWR